VTDQNYAATTLVRLLAVDWDGASAFDHRRSRAKLMMEYLRRAALWAQELDAARDWPFFDIAAHIAPGVVPPQDLASQLDTLIYEHIGWPTVQECCRAALRWAALLDSGRPLPDHLPDPYEPLLLVFERGGGFFTEHGFIDVDGAAIPPTTMDKHLAAEPVTSLDPEDLDALDVPKA
jgi:hypothetical protein